MDISIDITDIQERKNIIKEIEGDENKHRKEESFRRFEIYRERQHQYILERLAGELGINNVRDMRTMTSINLTRKMVHEMASIYRHEPDRDFSGLSEVQKEVMLNHYKYSKADVAFKKANRMFKLHEQCAIKTMPKSGFLSHAVLQPHHYDVIPNRHDPEQAEVYIISTFNRDRIVSDQHISQKRNRYEYEKNRLNFDRVNQKIGDPDDWDIDNDNKVYIWWNGLYNFKTDNRGRVLGDDGKPETKVNFNNYPNPIGKLPFSDIANEKDHEFWVRAGSNITEFNVDFGVVISDSVNINKEQGFAFPIITSVEEPKNLKVGPNRAMWLKVNPNDDTAQRPTFEFASPNPDLQGTIQLSEDLLRYFLVSKSISIKNMMEGVPQATSGVEKLLMMIERFEASQDDIDLFRWTEQSVYESMVRWHNVFRDVDQGLNSKVSGPAMPEDSEVQVSFGTPDMVISKKEKLDNIEKKLNLGLMTPVEAISELRDVDEDTADGIHQKIKEFNKMDTDELIEANRQIGMADDMDDEG